MSDAAPPPDPDGGREFTWRVTCSAWSPPSETPACSWPDLLGTATLHLFGGMIFPSVRVTKGPDGYCRIHLPRGFIEFANAKRYSSFARAAIRAIHRSFPGALPIRVGAFAAADGADGVADAGRHHPTPREAEAAGDREIDHSGDADLSALPAWLHPAPHNVAGALPAFCTKD